MYSDCDIISDKSDAETRDFRPELLPAAFGQDKRTQAQYGGCTVMLPFHAGAAHALFHQGLAGGFGHTRAQGPATGLALCVVHAGKVVGEITGRGFQLRACLAFDSDANSDLLPATPAQSIQ